MTNEPLSPETIGQIKELREHRSATTGRPMSFREIARRLKITKGRVEYYFNKGSADNLCRKKPEVAEVAGVPILTWGGIMWTQPVKSPRGMSGKGTRSCCDSCEYKERCKRAVRHHCFVACEKPLKFEMIQEE